MISLTKMAKLCKDRTRKRMIGCSCPNFTGYVLYIRLLAKALGVQKPAAVSGRSFSNTDSLFNMSGYPCHSEERSDEESQEDGILRFAQDDRIHLVIVLLDYLYSTRVEYRIITTF